MAEIFVHPDWAAKTFLPESNVAIIISYERINFDYFIYASCFYEFVQSHEEITQIIDTNPCQKVQRRRANQTMVEIPFAQGGALYLRQNQQWFLFGLYSLTIIESKVCSNKTFSSLSALYKHFQCESHSVTTATTQKAPKSFCSKALIFEDNFDVLNTSNWAHEQTLAGGGNWEFQWFVPDPENSFVTDGILHIKPTLTSNKFNERFLTKGKAVIPSGQCTRSDNYGCTRDARYGLLNPIRSASIRTMKSFSFKYGTVEVRAKMAAGDWLTSTISLFPKSETYGNWPASGEINLAEMRGNKMLFDGDENIGVEKVGCSLHFGPDAQNNQWEKTHAEINNISGFDKDFHVYKLTWTEDSITFYVDDIEIQVLKADKDLWKKFDLESSGRANPWIGGTNLAPFDQEFYVVISLKVGGISFYPDEAENKAYSKPWSNLSKTAMADFWRAKNYWLKSWSGEDVEFQVDYVRVYAS